jgi:hypothetical protein
MKKALLFLLFLPMALFAQNEPGSVQFWKLLKNHCGKSYSGEIIAGGKVGDGFVGEKLVLHVRSCEKNEIRMPFVVGDNHSRTWVLTLNDDNRIQLKHDHRNPDGSDEEITQYGGLSSNRGLANIQFFPADQFTSNLLPLASTNVWWITLNEEVITYNLKRVGSDRLFTVAFDLSKEVPTPDAPWGEKD